MIFVSAGTQFPFDRLVRMVDSVAEEFGEEIVAQAMPDKYNPVHFKLFNIIPSQEYNNYVANSRIVVAHAGMGIIITALKLGKPILVLPRLARLGEHRNEHQTSTATHLQQMGYVNVIESVDDLRRFLAAPQASANKQELRREVTSDLTDFISSQIQLARS